MLNLHRIRLALPPILGALVVMFASSVGIASASGTAPAPNCRVIEFQRSDFTNPTNIDNPYLPLKPGTQLTLSGTVDDGTGTLVNHTVIFTVTDLTKRINGVTTRVMYDVDQNDGQDQEVELSFFAQDKNRNVWNLGEYPEELTWNDRGTRIISRDAPNTWLVGTDGAKAGVHMFGEHPRSGWGYMQGYSPSIDFLDCAQTNAKPLQTIKEPFHNTTYRDAFVTDEWSPLSEDPTATQQKFHAKGVGIVQIGATNDPNAEVLFLTNYVQLSPTALSSIRSKALAQDKRGCSINHVYCNAPAAQ